MINDWMLGMFVLSMLIDVLLVIACFLLIDIRNELRRKP